MLQSWPSSGCITYKCCSVYGYCDDTAAPTACRWLDWFEPASAAEWSTSRFEQGCRRKQTLLACTSSGEGFVPMPSMMLLDKFSLDAGNWSMEECASRCAANYSCVAYGYVGELGRCLVWQGELMDSQMIGALGETLYLCVAVAATSTGRNAVKIALPVLAAALLVSCIFDMVCVDSESQNKLVPGTGPQTHGAKLEKWITLETLSSRPYGSPTLSLPQTTSPKTFMIGRGGFGMVYKERLDGGQVVAVKRLSKDSDQGVEEFKNEAILFAKLQHRFYMPFGNINMLTVV